MSKYLSERMIHDLLNKSDLGEAEEKENLGEAVTCKSSFKYDNSS